MSLITYIYEKELINQKLDTIVSETEIAEYYTNHPQNFLLKDNIIKVVYVKVAKNAPKIDKLKEGKILINSAVDDRMYVMCWCTNESLIKELKEKKDGVANE